MTTPHKGSAHEPGSRQPVRIFFAMIALLIVPAALALHSVRWPGTLEITSANPSPHGYTLSLLLFIIPLVAIIVWLFLHHDDVLVKKSFWLTIAILTPLGFALDLLFGNTFFTFPNRGATLAIRVPALGGGLPIEEFVFYLAGFMVILSLYLWADEYWLAAYNIADYAAAAREVPGIVKLHARSAWIGLALIAAAILYKKLLSSSPQGMPWYLIYLVLVAGIPAAGLFAAAKPFINWRALSFTFLFVLLVSLLWEATLAVPYGWWGFRPPAMLGLYIGAWSNLPIEEPCLWLAVSLATVIVYEVVKIWQAGGKRAGEAFFGSRQETAPSSPVTR